MKRISIVIMLCFVFSLFAFTSNAQTKEKKTLYIGIDGLVWKAITEENAPNLKDLMNKSVTYTNALAETPTWSANGWSSVLTATKKDKHGYYINETMPGKTNLHLYPSFFKYLKQEQPNLRTASFTSWGTINNKIVQNYATVNSNGDAVSGSHAAQDERVQNAALQELKRPDAASILFIQYNQIDGAGHDTGFDIESNEYKTALKNVDLEVRNLLQAVKERPNYKNEDWLIVVLTDHGGNSGGHGGNSYEEQNAFVVFNNASLQPKLYNDLPVQKEEKEPYQVKAVNFNNKVYGSFPSFSNLNLNGAGSFTIELRARATVNSGDPVVLSNKNWASGANKGFAIANDGFNGHKIRANFANGSAQVNLYGPVFKPDVWYPISIVVDRKKQIASLYVGGYLIQSANIASIGDLSTPYNINVAQDGKGDYGSAFQGNITEIRIFNKALSPEAIKQYALRPIDQNHPYFSSLVAYNKGDDASGNIYAGSFGKPDMQIQTKSGGIITRSDVDQPLFVRNYTDYGTAPELCDVTPTVFNFMGYPARKSYHWDGKTLIDFGTNPGDDDFNGEIAEIPVTKKETVLPDYVIDQQFYFFNGSVDSTFFDQGFIEQNGGSVILSIDKNNNPGVKRLPIDKTVVPVRGTNNLKINWVSSTSTTSKWEAELVRPAYGEADGNLYDYLVFYIYPVTPIDMNKLPALRVRVGDKYSPKYPLSQFVSSAPAGEWTKVTVPMSAIKETFDANYKRFQRVLLVQNDNDNVNYELLVDQVALQKQVQAPQIVRAKGYGKHAELIVRNANKNNTYNTVYRSTDGVNFSYLKTVTAKDSIIHDWVGTAQASINYYYKVAVTDKTGKDKFSDFSDTGIANVHPMSDNELLDMVQEYTFRYFWNYAFPDCYVMPISYDTRTLGWGTATTGATGYMVLAYISGVERGFVPRDSVVARLNKTTDFLLNNVQKYNGVYPNQFHYKTGKISDPFLGSDGGNTSDVNETALMLNGLLAARNYFTADNEAEKTLRENINKIYDSVEWPNHINPDNGLYYWNSYLKNGKTMFDLQNRGWMESMASYVYGIGSPTYPLPASLYSEQWQGQSGDANKGFSYRYPQYLYGEYSEISDPMALSIFMVQFPWAFIDPRGLKDDLCRNDYFEMARKTALTHYNYAIENPRKYKNLSDKSWGFSALTSLGGFVGGTPNHNDGSIAVDGALASMPFTPEESMKALRHIYYDLGEGLVEPFGIYDGYLEDYNYFRRDITSIQAGPYMSMIENYRSGLFWDLSHKDSDVQNGLKKSGLKYSNSVKPTLQDGLIGWYKADQGIETSGITVSSWKNSAGNFNNLMNTSLNGNSILVKDSVLNGYPVVRMSEDKGAKAYLSANLKDAINGQEVSAYIVGRFTGGGSNAVLAAIGTNGNTADESTYSDAAFLLKKNAANAVGIARKSISGNNVNSSINPLLGAENFAMYSTHFNKNEGFMSYNSNKFSGAVTSPTGDQYYKSADFDANQLRIGGSASASDNFNFAGDIAEVLIFDKNKASQGFEKMINSYLALKYGITPDISAHGGNYNLYDHTGNVIWDGSRKGEFYRDITGIGKDSELFGLNQSYSKNMNTEDPVAFMLGSTASPDGFKDDNSFLIWANNGQSFTEMNSEDDIQSTKRVWMLTSRNFRNDRLTAMIDISTFPLQEGQQAGILIASDPGLTQNVLFLDGNTEGNMVTINNISVPENGVVYMAYAIREDYPTALRSSNSVSSVGLLETIQTPTVYPNPTQGMVYIRLNDLPEDGELIKCLVFNVSGKLMQQKTFGSSDQSTMNLNLESLESGIYFISIQIGNGQKHVQKIMKY